jgi:tetratricopeptide (TPR) repeat protein
MFGNYNEGLAEYMKLIENDKNNVLYRYHIGVCHLNLNDNKEESIKWFEWVIKQPDHDINVWHDLGRAYAYAHRFDDAIASFKKFILLNYGEDDHKTPATRWIEMCETAKEMIKNPIAVEFENMGDDINSEYPDYNPYVPADESFLLFTSQRKGNVGNYLNLDGFITADLYQVNFSHGKWRKARRFTTLVNSQLVEECVGLTPDGSRVLLYYDNFVGEKDLFVSSKRGKTYLRAESLGLNVNTKEPETAAILSLNKKILFFSAEREDGLGGLDIYYSTKMPTGEWGEPINLGPTINTPYDDNFPYIGPDGTFYFASQGHNSMGDYDIFRTSYLYKDSMVFTKPENLGYPVNTVEDNKTISFVQSGRYAYMSRRCMGDGQGNLDVFRLTFKDVRPAYTVLRGRIFDNMMQSLIIEEHKKKVRRIDSLNAIVYGKAAKFFAKNDSVKGNKILEDIIKVDRDLKVEIEVVNKETGEVHGVYRSHPKTGKYAVIIPPGTFTIRFKTPDYTQYLLDDFYVLERDNRETMIVKDVYMDKSETSMNSNSN